MTAPLYRWPGMVRREVRGVVRRRLRALALHRSRYAPAAYAARRLAAAAVERARYATERTAHNRLWHALVLDPWRTDVDMAALRRVAA